MVLVKLCFDFFKIGAISFGGGLATLPHIYALNEQTGWCTAKELTNIITISQMTPGPLACNMATYIGVKISGISAGLLSTFAFIIPSIIFMSIVCKFLDKFKENRIILCILKNLRATAVALILISSIFIFKMAVFKNENNIYFYNINYKSILLLIGLGILVKKYKLSTLKTMVLAVFMGIFIKF